MDYFEYEDIIADCIKDHMCMWNVIKDNEIKTFTIIGPNFTDLEPISLFTLLKERGYIIQATTGSIFDISKQEIMETFKGYGYSYEEPDVMMKRLLEKI